MKKLLSLAICICLTLGCLCPGVLAAETTGTCGANVAWELTEDGTLIISGSGAMKDYDPESTPWYEQCDTIEAVIISEGVTSIGNSAFEGCFNLQSVEIPEGVTSIGNNAFQGCAALSAVVLPESLTTIGDYAFDSCGLSAVVFPENVTAIGQYAFCFCSSLKNITFLGSAPALSDKTFSRAKATVVYPCSDASWTEEKLANYGGTLTWEADHTDCLCPKVTWELVDGVLTVSGSGEMPYYEPECAPWFEQCDAIEKIVISEGITSVSEAAFQGCMNLTAVELPDSLTTIGDYAFDSCGLTELVVPSGVTAIGDYAFSYCSSLRKITFLGNAPAMNNSFARVTAQAFYPCGDATWTEDTMATSGGTLTWKADHNYENGVCCDCGEAQPNKVTGLYSDNVTTFSFNVHWDALPGATKYWVYINGNLYNSSKTTSLTVLKRTPNYEYTLRVIALLEDGTILPVSEANEITVQTEPYKATFTRTEDSITLIWDVVGCSKTWVYFGTDKDNLQVIRSTTESTFTMSGLEPDTMYYFQLSHLIGTTTSTPQHIFEIKTNEAKEPLPVVEGLLAMAVTRDSFTLAWEPLPNVTKYYISLDGTTYTSTTDTTITITKRKPNTSYQVAVTALLNDGTYLSVKDAKAITVTTLINNGIQLPDVDI